MKIIVDMNLSPEWVNALTDGGHEAVHWSKVGAADADDSNIMAWSRQNQSIVLTTDLDFGAILAASGAGGPSVIQLRPGRHAPVTLKSFLLKAIAASQGALENGALLTIDPQRLRLRILPLGEADENNG
jgi:predicted nuclease of predicted toxin-antitoxin system